MVIDIKLAKSFNNAVTNSDNLHTEDEDHPEGINWNFVDADVYMDLAEGSHPHSMPIANYMDQFNYLADCYTGVINPVDRIKADEPVLEV
jgi:hypothetical protein